jgi:hypothetical protein
MGAEQSQTVGWIVIVATVTRQRDIEALFVHGQRFDQENALTGPRRPEQMAQTGNHPLVGPSQGLH